jgi:hypothetical protein
MHSYAITPAFAVLPRTATHRLQALLSARVTDVCRTYHSRDTGFVEVLTPVPESGSAPCLGGGTRSLLPCAHGVLISVLGSLPAVRGAGVVK